MEKSKRRQEVAKQKQRYGTCISPPPPRRCCVTSALNLRGSQRPSLAGLQRLCPTLAHVEALVPALAEVQEASSDAPRVSRLCSCHTCLHSTDQSKSRGQGRKEVEEERGSVA